jgi:hypothetical protein
MEILILWFHLIRPEPIVHPLSEAQPRILVNIPTIRGRF